MADFSDQPCEIWDSNLRPGDTVHKSGVRWIIREKWQPWIVPTQQVPSPVIPHPHPTEKVFSHTPQNIPKIKGDDTATHLRNNFQTLGILTGTALGIGLEGMLWWTHVNCFLSKKNPSSLIKKHFRVYIQKKNIRLIFKTTTIQKHRKLSIRELIKINTFNLIYYQFSNNNRFYDWHRNNR